MPDVITATEYLEINSIPLATPAWRITDLVPLWAGPDLRGEDVTIEDQPGELAYRSEIHSTRVALELVIWGHRDRENVAYGSVREGLKANRAALQTGIVLPPMTTRGTHPAVWHQAGGTTVSAAVKVLGMPVRELSPRAIRATLQLKIMGGVWA